MQSLMLTFIYTMRNAVVMRNAYSKEIELWHAVSHSKMKAVMCERASNTICCPGSLVKWLNWKTIFGEQFQDTVFVSHEQKSGFYF